MRRSLTHAALAATKITAACMLLASCESPHTQPQSAILAARAVVRGPHMQHIAQLHYGTQALYGLCIAPACPARTPKTLARQEARLGVLAQTTIAADAAQTSAAAPVETDAESDTGLSDATELSVYFAPGSSRLDSAARHALQRFLTLVKPGSRMHIAGRTDNTGTPALNDAIAHQRAATVERYLRRHLHVTAVQFDVESGGACCYATANATEGGRQNNRRVELSLIADPPRQAQR